MCPYHFGNCRFLGALKLDFSSMLVIGSVILEHTVSSPLDRFTIDTYRLVPAEEDELGQLWNAQHS